MENFQKTFERKYTWIEGFMRNVRRYANKTAMIESSTGQSWSYRELNENVNRLANALYDNGIPFDKPFDKAQEPLRTSRKGDVVMLQMLNCAEFTFAYIACQKVHAVFCPLSYRLSCGEMAYNIDDSAPKVIIVCESKLQDMVQAIEMAHHKPERIVVVGEKRQDYTSYDEYVSGKSTAEPPYICEYNIYDETTRLYTSGTTGKPKSVPLTSINEVLSAHDVMIHFPMSNRDVTMNTTPWFHRGGLHCAGPCPTLYAGATMVIMGKFDALKTLRYVWKYNITFIVGVPTVLEELADVQESQGYDIRALKGIVTMGSPLERSACMRYQRILTPNIFNGYGTTETFWNTFLRPFDLPENAGTAGASMVDDDVRVVKVYEDRRAEPDDLAATDGTEVGEVIICSPAKSPYLYSGNPEETEKKFYKDFIYTNDLATWDEQQFITIIGRKDDMIISSGENIYPTEIEAVLNTHPAVKDSIVTCVPDKMRGQTVTAYIVLDPSYAEEVTAEQLDDFCKRSPAIANFKRPRYYRFVSDIPRNATGKKMHVRIKETARKDMKNGLLTQV